jgi:Ca-activated chloride channel family protein
MKIKAHKAITLSLILLIFSFSTVLADGIIIPDPCPPQECPSPLPLSQLVIRYHHVTVDITNQIAVTRVDQVFYNPNTWALEGTYIFPLPPDAVVTNFTLWVDGSPVQGQVLDAEQARSTYEQAIQNLQDRAGADISDPALPGTPN